MTLTWRKSSFSGGAGGSGGGGDCIEIAFGQVGALLRDSKLGDGGHVLHTSRAAFGALLHAVKHES